MKKQSYALAVEQNGETFEAAIPELNVKVTGASYQEAVIKALEAMDRAQVTRLKAAQKCRKKTVA